MNEDQAAMEKYGIKFEERKIYFYKSFKYGRLSDAVRYAELDQAKKFPDPNPSATDKTS